MVSNRQVRQRLSELASDEEGHIALCNLYWFARSFPSERSGVVEPFLRALAETGGAANVEFESLAQLDPRYGLALEASAFHSDDSDHISTTIKWATVYRYHLGATDQKEFEPGRLVISPPGITDPCETITRWIRRCRDEHRCWHKPEASIGFRQDDGSGPARTYANAWVTPRKRLDTRCGRTNPASQARDALGRIDDYPGDILMSIAFRSDDIPKETAVARPTFGSLGNRRFAQRLWDDEALRAHGADWGTTVDLSKVRPRAPAVNGLSERVMSPTKLALLAHPAASTSADPIPESVTLELLGSVDEMRGVGPLDNDREYRKILEHRVKKPTMINYLAKMVAP